MSFPVPKPGLVIRYSFLWSNEQAEGAREGAKDRPCAIVVAARRDLNGDIQTIVAPITHRPPDDLTASLKIPPAVCKNLGPDSGPHWLRLDELNRFAWLGYDLRPIPGNAADTSMGCCRPAFSGNCVTVFLPDKRRGPGASFPVMRNRGRPSPIFAWGPAPPSMRSSAFAIARQSISPAL